MTAPQQPAVMPVFIDVTVPSGEPGPGFDVLIGRPCAFVAKQSGVSKAFEAADKRADANGNVPTVWYDIFIGGDGPIIFGAAPKANPPRPYPTHQIQTPCVFRNQMSSHELIHRALAPLVGQGVFVTGVIDKLGRAYVINKLDPSDPRAAQLQQQVTALVTGQIPEPEPTPVSFGQPVAAPAQPQYAQPQYLPAQQSYAQAQPAPHYANTIPQAQQQQPQMPPPMAAPQPQAIAQIFQPQPAVDAVPPQLAATGMTPEFWATLAQPQRDIMLQMAAQAAAPAQQPVNTY